MPSTSVRRLGYAAATIAVVVVLALVAAACYAGWTIRRSYPTVDGALTVSGLRSDVTVLRDEWGVPQLYADNPHDLFFGQGYVQAQDRFWQMDVHRHLTEGRLAEMFGEDLVSRDAFVRTLGWARVARQELSMLSPGARHYLEAYSQGVNAYLREHKGSDISVEYAVLGLRTDYTPQPWRPVDSLAWLKAMAWNLRANMGSEAQRALLAGSLPVERVKQLFPSYPYDRHKPIVRGGRVVDGRFQPAAESGGARTASPDDTKAARPAGTDGGEGDTASGATAMPRLPSAARGALANVAAVFRQAAPELRQGWGAGIGSNSWVVSGARTTTGKPILANDPHLSPTLPSIWYQMGLHCRTVDGDCPYDVAGFTFPGLPGVVIGHNAHIAWGFTNLGADVTDLYLEKVSGGKYLYEGDWRPLDTRRETIKVAGGEPVTITVRSTEHGPLLSDVRDQLGRIGHVAACHHLPAETREAPGDRTAAVPTPSSGCDRDDAPARDQDHAGTKSGGGQRRAGPDNAGNDDNADNAGNAVHFEVTLRWTALEPSRTGDAIFALDSATGWQEFRGAAKLFAVPAQNLIYADTEGNIGYQAPGRIPIRAHGQGRWPVPGWTDRYDWQGFIDFDELPHVLNPERGYIVTANNAVVGPSYPHLLTKDWSQGYRSHRITELIEGSGKLSVRDMTRIQMDTRNPNAAALAPHLLRAAGEDAPDAVELLRGWDYTQPPDSAPAAYFNAVWKRVLAATFHDELPKRAWPSGGGRWFAVMRRLLAHPESRWWDDADTPNVTETRDDALRTALRKANQELTDRLGDDPTAWKWGTLHTLTLTSQTFGTSGVGVLEAFFNRGPLKLGGGGSIVDATHWDASDGYEVTVVPSMRMVVDLADFDRSRWVNLTGASGHVRSEHYVDQAYLWRRGDTTAFPFSRQAVHHAAEAALRLKPQ